MKAKGGAITSGEGAFGRDEEEGRGKRGKRRKRRNRRRRKRQRNEQG